MIAREDMLACQKEISAVARRYSDHKVRVFGSVARGEQREDSDLDLVLRFESDRSLFDRGGLIADLEQCCPK